MLVQALVAQATVEALDEAVLRRLAGRDVVPLDAGFLAPGQDSTTGQFSAIVAYDRAWQAASLGDRRQFALTPVFLLTAIGSILNVVAQRLGRVIDRARTIEGALPHDPALRTAAIAELRVLDRRMRLANRAVSLCVGSALFACVLIAALFVAEATPLHASRFVPALFVVVMALLIAGLSAFLMEVRIATRTVRVRTDLIAGLPPPG